MTRLEAFRLPAWMDRIESIAAVPPGETFGIGQPRNGTGETLYIVHWKDPDALGRALAGAPGSTMTHPPSTWVKLDP